MKVLLFLTTLAVTTLTQNQGTDKELDQSWETFKVTYGKRYSSDLQEAKRRAKFMKNLNMVSEHNLRFERGEVSFSMNLNHLADLNFEEFAATGLGVLKDVQRDKSSARHQPEDTQDNCDEGNGK